MKIHKVILNTNDIIEQKEFYFEKLELPIVEETDFEITFQAGETLLTFQLVAYPVAAYHFAFNIPSKSLNDAKAFLDRQEIHLVEDPKTEETEFRFESWKADAIYFYDGGQNIVEFIARENISDHSDKFKILNVSEIGVPVEDVVEAKKSFVQTYGYQEYDAENTPENFCAIGDEEGLIIFVSNERPWFPTMIPAINDEVEIEVDVEEL